MSKQRVKLSDSIAALISIDSIHRIDNLTLQEWQQRAEYLETSLAQWQGEEFDLDEPVFMVQLTLPELDRLIDFISLAAENARMRVNTSTATWKMLNEKMGLLNIQVSKFNQQKLAELTAQLENTDANS